MSMSSDPSPTQDRASGFGWNLLTFLTAIVLLGTVLLIFNGRRLLNRYEHWRADQVAEEATALLDNERWEAASQLIMGALRRTPDQPALLRVTAELFVRAYQDPQSAVVFQKKVVDSGQGLPADQRRLADMLLLTGDTSAAKRAYDRLPASEQEGRKGMELHAGILRAQGEMGQALAILRRAWQRPPQDNEARLRLAILDEEQAFESAKTEASRVIWDIARQDDPTARIAISHLTSARSLTAQQAADLKNLVESHPRTNERLRYAMLQTYLRLHPLERDRVISTEAQRTANRPPSEKFEFLRWLGMEGEHARILQILPEKAVSHDADLFLLYVDALTAAQEWKSLLHLLQTEKPPVSTPTVQVIQAQCYAHLQPDLQQARQLLHSVYESALGRDFPLLLRAAAVAEQHHMNDLAVEGYRIVANARPALRLQLLEKIVELLRQDRDLQGMMTTLIELRTLRPGSQSYADQLNYLRLVSGLEMETAYNEVLGFQQPVQPLNAPSVTLPPALLNALAFWRFGQDEAMRQALASLPDPARLAPGPRAVVACLYAISGRDVAGFRLAEKISPLSLLDAETAFLNRSLR